ncbi:hypothetical protein DFJ73DRAFT_216337 [Zopfochytrium polystomum]|nr:hypothetical protein DFJ73DRAFT_216337 [Zopfochytrium polystomum]
MLRVSTSSSFMPFSFLGQPLTRLPSNSVICQFHLFLISPSLSVLAVIASVECLCAFFGPTVCSAPFHRHVSLSPFVLLVLVSFILSVRVSSFFWFLSFSVFFFFFFFFLQSTSLDFHSFRGLFASLRFSAVSVSLFHSLLSLSLYCVFAFR